MLNLFYMALYGLLLLSGCFMLFAWHRLLHGYRREGDTGSAMTAFWLMLNSAGTIILFAVAVSSGFATGVWATRAGWDGIGVLIGLALLEASKVGLIHRARSHSLPAAWRWFLIVSTGWLAFTAWWLWL